MSFEELEIFHKSTWRTAEIKTAGMQVYFDIITRL
jgi:hypothetical protein